MNLIFQALYDPGACGENHNFIKGRGIKMIFRV